jgi:Mg2+ and Co2+ transporter CorA
MHTPDIPLPVHDSRASRTVQIWTCLVRWSSVSCVTSHWTWLLLTAAMHVAGACREELSSLNRSIQSTAKAIKGQLEGLSRDRAALQDPQQAKLRRLMQDFAATLQVRQAGQEGTHTSLHAWHWSNPCLLCFIWQQEE